MQDVLVLILGGGRGTRLFPLTKHRSEPAVPFAGKYRLIDIPVSNCINSSLNRIYVLTQYMSVSLHRHIAQAYKFNQFSRGFVEVLAAQQTNERADWFRGTADAIRQNIIYVETDSARDILVLCGDQIYRTDFNKMIRSHRESGAEVTLSVVPVNEEQVSNYGIVRVGEDMGITQLVEKPTSADQLKNLHTERDWLQKHGYTMTRGNYLANMGMYLFRRDALMTMLAEHPDANDIVTQILAPSVADRKIRAHLFNDYWEDVGTVKHYFEANLTLTGNNPPFDFHRPEGVIYTRMRDLPATQVMNATVEQSLLSDGCFVDSGAEVHRSVLGVRSRIGKNARMRDVVMMGANYYDNQVPPQPGQPLLGVGEGAVLEKVILDKNARIGNNVKILNKDHRKNADNDNFYIRDGIVVIPDSATIADGTEI